MSVLLWDNSFVKGYVVIALSTHVVESCVKPVIFQFIRIRSDHNQDNTASLLHTWVKNVRFLYHGIDINTTNINDSYSDSVTVNHWSPLRFKRLIHLRQTALEEARRLWADYIFVSIVSFKVLYLLICKYCF